MERMTQNKHPQYWAGVNDALALVQSYLSWVKTHPDARDPQEYVSAAQKAVARRCRSCLRELLAVPFEKEE